MSSLIEILLLQDIKNVGRKGDVTSVKAGYANNFLMPKGQARPAHPGLIKLQQRLAEERQKEAAAARQESERLASQLEGLSVKHFVRVDEQGKMYGSVSVKDLIKLIEKEGFKLSSDVFHAQKAIKELGVHTLALTLPEEVSVSIELLLEADVN
jgi:large subunit ribosomal protein L9